MEKPTFFYKPTSEGKKSLEPEFKALFTEIPQFRQPNLKSKLKEEINNN